MKICNISNKSLIKKRRNTLTICLLAILLLLATSVINSQTDSIDINEISDEKDFRSSIQTIFQDREGYLWFARNNVVERYDGYDFQSYSYNPEDTSGISDASVTHIYEDKDGNLTWT